MYFCNMLSILIPVHNHDIRTLIRQLAHQCSVAHLTYEIICLDDASSSAFKNYYTQIKKELKIQWLSTSKNIGRSAARNTLARQANFENILYLDCDVQITDDHFISHYVHFIILKKYQVIYGSCNYPVAKPKDDKLVLHWLYGTKKENPPLKQRNKNPYTTFHTVNFIVKKNIILKYPFDESISKYGFEDSLWAETLKQNSISILHIDNPVMHLGIHPSKIFLRKIAQSVQNLIYLELNKKSIQTHLLFMVNTLEPIGLNPLIFKCYQFFEKRIVKNLMGVQPSLFQLSIYKLGLFLRFRKKIIKNISIS